MIGDTALTASARPPEARATASQRPVLVLVTGMSGAGRSTALKVLEDSGFEAVDNLPLSLLGAVTAAPAKPLALGLDTRTRGFSVEHILAGLDGLRERGEWRPALVFMTCDDDVLQRRYTETRRRHPLATDRPVQDGIAIERRLLAPLLDAADLVIDTSDLAQADLRRLLRASFAGDDQGGLTINVLSFSYRQGVPREADLVVDVRFLRNPYYDPALRPLDGTDPAVGAYVEADPDYPQFFDNLTRLVGPLLPRYQAEGKSYLTIAVGCTGGRHRSVYTAERLRAWLGSLGLKVALGHRDRLRHAAATPRAGDGPVADPGTERIER